MQNEKYVYGIRPVNGGNLAQSKPINRHEEKRKMKA